MAEATLLTAEQVCQLVYLDDETGALCWRERTIEWFRDHAYSPKGAMAAWNLENAHQPCPVTRNNGYTIVHIEGRSYPAHRVIWAVAHSRWPAEQIDHINGNRSDNRLENLREATHQENQRNKALRKDNTSGFHGISWDTKHQHWKVSICKRYVGCYSDLAAAVKARKAAERRLGFHPNHGRARGLA